MFASCTLKPAPGTFIPNFNKNSFVGLDPDDQAIPLFTLSVLLTKQGVRRCFEMDHNFRYPGGQSFAAPKVKGHSPPSPVINKQLHGHKSFRPALFGDPFFRPVSLHGLPPHMRSQILASDYLLAYLVS